MEKKNQFLNITYNTTLGTETIAFLLLNICFNCTNGIIVHTWQHYFSIMAKHKHGLSAHNSYVGHPGGRMKLIFTWTSNQGVSSRGLHGHGATASNMMLRDESRVQFCLGCHSATATANTLTTQYMVRFSHLTVQLPERWGEKKLHSSLHHMNILI